MPIRLPVALLALAIGITVGLVCVSVLSPEAADDGRPARPVPASSGQKPAPARALAILHDWDARRSAAWAAADTTALGRLYTAGSAAGRSDVRLLRRYRERGVSVFDVRMQVIRVSVLVDRPRQVVLRVTERLVSRVVRVGDRSLRLPRDTAETRVVELRRVQDSWQVAAVVER